jgi:hypothetical protein
MRGGWNALQVRIAGSAPINNNNLGDDPVGHGVLLTKSKWLGGRTET